MKRAVLNLWQENGTLLMLVTASFDAGNKIIFYTEVVKSNPCDNLYEILMKSNNFSDVYILIRGDITVTVGTTTQLVFKYCAQFTNCMTKISGITIDDAVNLHLVMSVYNLLEYSSNYYKTTGS